MKGSLSLGRVAGISVFIHWSFLLLIGYIVFSSYRAGQDAVQTLWSVGFVLSIFLTVYLHEMGHALAARRYGIATRDITLLPIGGLARLERFPEKPVQELVVALAGPAVNVVIAIIVAVFIKFPAVDEMDGFVTGEVNASTFFFNFMVVNVWLVIFNLIPAFPMDGGRVLRSLLAMRLQRHVATKVAASIGQVLAIGFVIAGFYLNPFLVIIGIFIFVAARGESEQVSNQFLLHGSKVRDAVMKETPALNAQSPVKDAVDKLLAGQAKNFLITENGEPVGSLGRNELISALAEGRQAESLASVMNRNLVFLDGNMPLEEAWKKSLVDAPPLMLVRENGRLTGVLDTENIREYIMVRDALAKSNQ